MQIFEMQPSELIPYENNPRHNDGAVDAVAESIKQFGFKVPIVIDKDNIIIAGHTRHKAALKLGLDAVPVIRADDLTDEQVRAFRLADNKTAELAEWDESMLAEELAAIDGIDMADFGFEMQDKEDQDEEENPYTDEVNIPQYNPTGKEVDIADLIDIKKTEQLLETIKNSNVSTKEKKFLQIAAYRHCVFKYKDIAEYYATASEEMQDLMEDSALVIIDVDDAIAKGYATLKRDIEDIAFDDE